jgi:hypothetical protein
MRSATSVATAVLGGMIFMTQGVALEERENAPLGLSAHFQVDAKELVAEYEVTNTRAHAVYLFNVLWAFDAKGQYVAASSPAYVSLRRDGQLYIGKIVPPLPRDEEVELRVVPFATKVEAGRSYKETLKFPLPVSEYSAYFPAKPDSKYRSATAHSVVFALQFVNDVKGMEAKPAPLPDALQLSHPKLLGLIETVRARPEKIEVPVNQRDGNFEEFE